MDITSDVVTEMDCYWWEMLSQDKSHPASVFYELALTSEWVELMLSAGLSVAG